MFLPMVLNSLNPLLKETFVNELLKCNERTKDYGLVLTPEGAESIIEARNNILNSLGRVDMGIEVALGLIENFYTSTFINEENYVSVLNEFQEIFYYMKNETEDMISDDKLICIIKDYYENLCGGSLELLKSCLEEFIHDFRRKAHTAEAGLGGEE
ncbi:MAG: DUF6323 family protein [Bacillota bacterium]|nr:DUF6323 family protein [Bacillota bacterium]